MILKEGKVKEKELRTWIAKCRHCKCVFTYDENSEILPEGWTDDIRFYLQCPWCLEKTPLPLFKRKYRGQKCTK